MAPNTLWLWPCRGKSYTRLLQLASVSALALYGWDAGIMGGILNTPQFDRQIHAASTDVTSFISSGIILGDIFGCAIIAPLSWTVGRRVSILLSCWTALLGIIIQTAAVNSTMMIIGRVILGLGNGAISAAVPVFVHEASVARSSGTADDRTTKVMWNIGLAVSAISIVAWIGFGVYQSPFQNGWRVLLASQAVFILVPIVIFHGVLESPRWLYAKGRIEEGDASLERLNGKTLDDPEVKAQKAELIKALQLEAEDSASINLAAFFKKDTTETKVVRRIWISWILQVGRPFYGGNLITYYGKSIIGTLHFSTDITAVVTAALNSMVTLGVIISFFTVRHFGRRDILLFGALVQTSAILIFTILGTLPAHLTTNATRWAQIAMLFWFEAGSGLSWIWMVYLYAIEIVPTRYRGQAGGIGNVGTWTMAFVFVYSGPIAIKDVGIKFFILFILGGSIVTLLVYLFVKETKGMTLEEIDLLWASEDYKARHQDVLGLESLESLYDKSGAESPVSPATKLVE
ncbi:general substrate transporter [Hymenopellis radicata]|nr:general substrate transporter [Hymenopellis radicata]